MEFCGKVVLITGASSGIGAHLAIHLSNLGASLSLTGRNSENLHQTTINCKTNGSLSPLEIVADVCLDAAKIIDETIKYFGKLDILINNAGMGKYGTIETTSLQQYDEIMNTNLRSMYHLTMLAVPHLIKTKGNIVNVSSISAIKPYPGLLAYSVSKAAIDHFTKAIAIDLAPKGVRANAVNPGFVRTQILNRAGFNDEEVDKHLELEASRHPLGRIALLVEVSNAIEFLASDKASFITGVCLAVDGGRHLMGPT